MVGSLTELYQKKKNDINNNNRYMKHIFIQDVENILESRNGRGLLEALTQRRVLKNGERIQLNQVLVSHLIQEHGWK